eukprot:gene6988-5035_t
MAFQFDQQYFGEPIPLNIGKALHENNSLKHAFYEVLANALDGGAGQKPRIEFDDETNTVTIRNEGHVIKPEHFRVGSGKNPQSIHGQHGFGMKDYIATFTRFGCEVDIKSGGLRYSFELKLGPLGEVVFLTVLPREDGHDTVVAIKGPLHLIDLSDEFETAKGKFLAFLDVVPLLKSSRLCLDVYPLEGHKRKLDYIFVNGAQKTVSNYKLSFIYNFKRISDKDRKLIGLEHDAKFKQMQIFQDLKTFVLEHRDLEYQPYSLEQVWVKSAEQAEQAEKLANSVAVSTAAARTVGAVSLPSYTSVVPSITAEASIPIPPPSCPFKAVGKSSFCRQVKPHFSNVLLGLDRLLADRVLMLSPSPDYYTLCRRLANRFMSHIKDLDGVESVQLVGSLSRQVGLVGTMDIDLLVVKKPEREGNESASAETVNVPSLIKERLLENEPALEVYLESEKLIKFIFDAVHVDVVIVESVDTRAIQQFTAPIQIAKFYNGRYPNDVSVVAAMKFLLSHVKPLISENQLKSVILEFIVWNEREEMISEEGWSERHLTPAEETRELFYRCVTFVLSSYSVPKRFSKWETILRKAAVCLEEPYPEDTSLLAFNADSIRGFARALCVEEDYSYCGGGRGGRVRYNGRVW